MYCMDAPQADDGALREGRGRKVFRNDVIIADRRFRRHSPRAMAASYPSYRGGKAGRL